MTDAEIINLEEVADDASDDAQRVISDAIPQVLAAFVAGWFALLVIA